ncbi:hypothetical protein PsorP6_012506 [Peronosclerospora sorghi]|uniref:Uncharacterized protein n=1 Tax=Peronosclerospora sorghi TaxID=230839 RepID=A0ACC0WJ23_9STRA|nr:hypothetical protein PsorP6_012506 [Peronosclerospora sorghi]
MLQIESINPDYSFFVLGSDEIVDLVKSFPLTNSPKLRKFLSTKLLKGVVMITPTAIVVFL